MIRSRLLVPLVAAILTFLTLPAGAQVYDTFVIPAVANRVGEGGSLWVSELTIFNPQPHKLNVSVIFLPSGLNTGSEVLVEIPSNQFFTSSDILGDVFRRAGTGALLLATFPEENKHVPDPTILALSFVVRSNTYTTASGGKGTFGQAIPGLISGLMDYEYEQLSAVSIGIRSFGEPNVDGYRTNVGAVNLGRYTVRMLVNVYDELGRTVAREIPFDVPPQGHVQDRLPVNISRGTVEYFVFDPGVNDPDGYAVVFAYASVVDNRSGDPVYVDPVLLASPGYLYGKALPKDPLNVGKRIDTEIARRVRSGVERTGRASMITLEDGSTRVVVTD